MKVKRQDKMTTRIKYSALILPLFLMLSCAADTEESSVTETAEENHTEITENDNFTESTNNESEMNDEIDNELIESRYHYDQDWEIFKEAIIAKDIKTVNAFSNTNKIDTELLIQTFEDVDFLKQLKVASYEDLETDLEGPEVRLVFSASVAGSDEDGNEYESGIYLYFLQGENNLILEEVLMAG